MAESASFQRGSPGEKAADVARGYGAQECIGNGVKQHVAVGVAGRPSGWSSVQSA